MNKTIATLAAGLAALAITAGPAGAATVTARASVTVKGRQLTIVVGGVRHSCKAGIHAGPRGAACPNGTSFHLAPARFTIGHTAYSCKSVVRTGAASFRCTASHHVADPAPTGPRPSHGHGTLVLNAAASPRDDVLDSGVTLVGRFSQEFGIDSGTGLMITPFYLHVENTTGFDVIVNDVSAASFESSDPIGCPTSGLSIGAWDFHPGDAIAPITVEQTFGQGASPDLTTWMGLGYPVENDAACSAATITVNLESN